MKELSDFSQKIENERIKYVGAVEKIGLTIPFDLIYSESIKNDEIPKKIANDYKLYIEAVKQMEYFLGTFKVNLTPKKLILRGSSTQLREFKGSEVKNLYHELYKKVEEIIPKLQNDLPF